MTSLKKPLIAIASALVLVGTVFSAPANAATAALTVNDVAVGTLPTSAINAVTLPVPADNSVDATDALKIALTGITAGTTVSVTGSNVLLLTTLANAKSNSGLSTLSILTGTGTTATIFAYTKTTALGSVTVTADGVSTTYYVKGVAGSLNNIQLEPVVAGLGTVAKVAVVGTDVFGNSVDTSDTAISLQVIGTNFTNTYSVGTDATGVAVKEISGLAVGTYDIVATATVSGAIAGLTAPVGFVRSTLKVVDFVDLVATRDAEIAELKTKLVLSEALANSNKKKYNKLAKKWNKKFPNNKVALLK